MSLPDSTDMSAIRMKEREKDAQRKVFLTLDMYEFCLHGMKTRHRGDTLS